MGISEKQLHKLSKVLADIHEDPDEIRRIVKETRLALAGKDDDIDTSNINFENPSFTIWKNILGNNNRKELIIAILETANEMYKNEYIISFILQYKTEEDKNLGIIAQALMDKKCILFIGPEILRIRDNEGLFSFNSYTCKDLLQDLRSDQVYYDEEHKDNLSYIAQRYGETDNYVPGDLARKAKRIFEDAEKDNLVDKAIYDQLVQFPFKMVINANPDKTFYNLAEKKQGGQYKFLCYDRSNGFIKNNEERAGTPLADTSQQAAPGLVYNIFGEFDLPNSILHTESEFLGFINAIIRGNPQLDQEVLNFIQESHTYLFVGFDFSQWYFKVLFELFQLKKQDHTSLSCNPVTVKNIHKEFYEGEFKIFFVENQIERFLSQLFNKYSSLTRP